MITGLIPDVDIAAHVGKDLFLDEKIPRHESGQGYVRMVERSVLWKEKEASTVFTYQGQSWTIMSGAYNHVRSKRGKDERSMAMFIRKEVEHQERLEAAGYRSPTWRVLRALKSLHLATQLQGESAVTAPPFFPNAGRGTVWFWGNESSIYQSFFTFPPSKDFINIKNIFFFFLRSKDIRNFPF